MCISFFVTIYKTATSNPNEVLHFILFSYSSAVGILVEIPQYASDKPRHEELKRRARP